MVPATGPLIWTAFPLDMFRLIVVLIALICPLSAEASEAALEATVDGGPSMKDASS